jgi:hypothetical protein
MDTDSTDSAISREDASMTRSPRSSSASTGRVAGDMAIHDTERSTAGCRRRHEPDGEPFIHPPSGTGASPER